MEQMELKEAIEIVLAEVCCNNDAKLCENICPFNQLSNCSNVFDESKLKNSINIVHDFYKGL